MDSTRPAPCGTFLLSSYHVHPASRVSWIESVEKNTCPSRVHGGTFSLRILSSKSLSVLLLDRRYAEMCIKHAVVPVVLSRRRQRHEEGVSGSSGRVGPDAAPFLLTLLDNYSGLAVFVSLSGFSVRTNLVPTIYGSDFAS